MFLKGNFPLDEEPEPCAPPDDAISWPLDADGLFFLEAVNAAYEPIRPRASLAILGVVMSVCRRVER